MKKVLAKLALFSVEMVLVLLVFLLSLLAFVFITHEVFTEKSTAFDLAVFSWIHPFVNAANTRFMVWVSFFASHVFLMPANILLALYFLFTGKSRWYSVKVPVVALGSFAVMSSLKIFFSRPRPLDPVYEAARGFSFPSGHAMSAMTFYGLLVYLVWQRVKSPALRWLLTVILVCCIVLIGFSRVYLRVHFASDVLAGFAMGAVWLVASLWVMHQLERYTRRKVTDTDLSS